MVNGTPAATVNTSPFQGLDFIAQAAASAINALGLSGVEAVAVESAVIITGATSAACTWRRVASEVARATSVDLLVLTYSVLRGNHHLSDGRPFSHRRRVTSYTRENVASAEQKG